MDVVLVDDIVLDPDAVNWLFSRILGLLVVLLGGSKVSHSLSVCGDLGLLAVTDDTAPIPALTPDTFELLLPPFSVFVVVVVVEVEEVVEEVLP